VARFHGKVGFGVAVEDPPGVYQDVINEYSYFGDVVRNTRQLVEAEKVNKDVAVAVSISIVADEYARGNITAIRYLEWMGVLWAVSSVEVQHPRLILGIGEVYNGPTPGAPESP
jgi:hypothetical protein